MPKKKTEAFRKSNIVAKTTENNLYLHKYIRIRSSEFKHHANTMRLQYTKYKQKTFFKKNYNANSPRTV